jgi:hypothetical protein
LICLPLWIFAQSVSSRLVCIYFESYTISNAFIFNASPRSHFIHFAAENSCWREYFDPKNDITANAHLVIVWKQFGSVFHTFKNRVFTTFIMVCLRNVLRNFKSLTQYIYISQRWLRFFVNVNVWCLSFENDLNLPWNSTKRWITLLHFVQEHQTCTSCCNFGEVFIRSK